MGSVCCAERLAQHPKTKKSQLCFNRKATTLGWRVQDGTLLLLLKKLFERRGVSSGGTGRVAVKQRRLGSVRPIPGGYVSCSEKCGCGMLLCKWAGRNEVKSHEGAGSWRQMRRGASATSSAPTCKSQAGRSRVFSCQVPKQ